MACLFAISALLFNPEPVNAGCGDNCTCVPIAHGSVIPFPPGFSKGDIGNNTDIRGTIRQEHEMTTRHMDMEFDDMEEFLVNESNPRDPTRIWGGYLWPAWMMMNEQLVHTAMYQMLILGSLLDAKAQLETQTLFQKLTNEAHQNYHTDHEMCVVGTNVRSLAAAERRAEFTTFVLSQRSIDRQMANLNSAAARGEDDDECFRLRQFRKRYCDNRDNNEHMQWICDPQAAATAAGVPFQPLRPECVAPNIAITNETKNKDISYARTIDRTKTLNIDFVAPAATPTEDEEDIFALASNLYSHDVMFRMPESSLRQRQSQDEILDMRGIVAKRNVAEHSFNTIVGLRAMGNEESKDITYPYMKLIMERLDIGDDRGWPEEELARFLKPEPSELGEADDPDLWRPSYDAQMEVLTKRLFQSPDFYANLYDEPVNVDRKSVALQAIGLMQDFDTWNSYLRTEAMLSVILELELLRLNNQVQNQLGTVRSGGLEL